MKVLCHAYLTSFCMTSGNVKLTTTNGRLPVSLPTLPISKSIFFQQNGWRLVMSKGNNFYLKPIIFWIYNICYLVLSGLPLGGRTPYITSKNRLRTPKLHIKDVPRTSENSLVRPKNGYRDVLSAEKTRPHLPDYVIYVPPSYWKLIYFVYWPR